MRKYQLSKIASLPTTLPIIELDEVFHVGTFDKRNRRRSYEGLALSVSRCPDRWKDGHLDPSTLRYPLWAIDTRGACFLDESTINPNDREQILKDAELRGILKRTNRLRVTTMFKDGESWYEDLHDPSNSKWANDKSVVKTRHVQRVQVYELSDDAVRAHNFLPAVGWLAEWSAITMFAEDRGLDGAWQRYYGCRTDIVHPHGCIFRPELWPIAPSDRRIEGRAPLEELPPPKFIQV